MRPIYVQHDQLHTEDIGYSRTEDEAVLTIGSYRLPSSSNDLSQLREAADLFRKVREEGDRAHRDVLARIAFLEQQEKHRAMAPAVTQTTPEPGSMFRRPCSCGASNDARLVHRLDGPCYPTAQDSQPCPTCKGNGCADCIHSGLAAVNTSQPASAQVYQFPQTSFDILQGPPTPAPTQAPAN
ncbi:hypothetical protein ACQPYK_25240 [Streptosporangium sp. CA-135522]|uniref:hypothetical protein n=1 Tax=Streptosporangium sp. CA-135522 TaxID=3240072 RepID=UPI003D904213